MQQTMLDFPLPTASNMLEEDDKIRAIPVSAY
jgi:hypothetical protein